MRSRDTRRYRVSLSFCFPGRFENLCPSDETERYRSSPSPRPADTSQTRYHSLKVCIRSRRWNEKAERASKTHGLHEDVNGLIETKLPAVERERLRLLTRAEVPTAEALKAAVAGKGHAGSPLDFADGFLQGVEARGEVQRAQKERVVLAKLEASAGKPLPFRRLTTASLDRWTAWPTTERKASTAGAAITVLRLHYNRAVCHGVGNVATPHPQLTGRRRSPSPSGRS